MKENEIMCCDFEDLKGREMSREISWELSRKSVHLYHSYERRIRRKSSRRKSLNLNSSLNNSYKLNNSKMLKMKRRLSTVRYEGGMCGDESLELGTPNSYVDSSFEKDSFDIINFILKSDGISWSKGELPLTRESILEGFIKENKLLSTSKPSDDEVEFLLFGKLHNFKNYKEQNFRDLMQLTYASLYGKEKDLLKLKLLQAPERMKNISLLDFEEIKNNFKEDVDLVEQLKDKILDLYFFFSKENLERQEIEIFNKIIYWLTGFSRDLPHKKAIEILNRVKIDLIFYNPMYLILIEFIEKELLSKLNN